MNDNLFSPDAVNDSDEFAEIQTEIVTIRRRLYEGDRAPDLIARAQELNIPVPQMLVG